VTKKIKVGVWGPGGIGACAVRELARIPNIVLVGVLAYSVHKDGVDAGTLVGIGELGVKTTTDVSRFLATKPDLVFYAARDFTNFNTDPDILMLLEAGVNVITVLPYHYPKIRGDDVAAKFDAAGKKGGATLFGTGINPGFMGERLAVLMTTLSQEVEFVRIGEYFNCQNLENAVEVLKIIGFGTTPEELAANTIAAQFPSNKIPETVAHMADMLGITLDRIERTTHHYFAEETFDVPGIFAIERGTAAMISYRWTGYSKGRPRLSNQIHWYMHECVRPAAVTSNDCWVIETEGRPSTRVVLDIMGSVERNLTLLPDSPTPAGFLASVSAMIAAIPNVIAAEPGLMVTAPPDIHWRERAPG
jgi:hypothetical protein